MTALRLAAAAVAVQLADALTWGWLPLGAERNPVAAAAVPWQAWGLKAALVVLVLAVAWIVRSRPAIAETVLLAAVIAGALGTGSNLAAAASRSAQEPAPIPDDGTGFEEGTPTPEAPGLSAAPSEVAPHSPWPVLVSPSVAPRDEKVLPRHLRAPALSGPTPAPRPRQIARLEGPASWFCLPGRSACTRGFAAGGAYAAAGPPIRAALGAGWRGRVVLVAGIRVKLIDWCACGGGRLLDLYGSVFRQLAPLSAGVITVTVVVPRGTIP